MIKVYIIRTPNNDRWVTLHKQLENSRIFEVHFLEAIILTNNFDSTSINKLVNKKRSRSYLGRELTIGELGCSLSHNEVRRLISLEGRGGMILEDDARINNLSELENLAINFLDTFQGRKVLNLSSSLMQSSNEKASQNYRILKSIGPTELAVGYILTSEAAKELVKKNSPVWSVADWPDSNCRYYFLSQPLVKHGDEKTTSVIEHLNVINNENRKERSTGVKWNLMAICRPSKVASRIKFRANKLLALYYNFRA